MQNHVGFQGRLAKDIELKYTASNVTYAEFTVCWSEKYKEIETKCFLRCKAWRNTAEFINKYFHKGDMIIIDGHLVTEEWEKDGQKQSRTICLIDKAHFAGSKVNAAPATDVGAPSNIDSSGFMIIPEDIDDELPFA